MRVATDAFGNALGESLVTAFSNTHNTSLAKNEQDDDWAETQKIFAKNRPLDYVDGKTAFEMSSSNGKSWTDDSDEFDFGSLKDGDLIAAKGGPKTKSMVLPQYDIHGSVDDLPKSHALSRDTYDFGTEQEDVTWNLLNKLNMKNQPSNSRESVADVQRALGFAGKEVTSYLDLHTLREIRDWKSDFEYRKISEMTDTLLNESIKPVLRLLDRDSPAMENLLLGTALHESKQFTYRKQTVGPALGLFQIEPVTAEYYLGVMKAENPSLHKVFSALGTGDVKKDLYTNDQFGAAMATVIFDDRMKRGNISLPKPNDIEGIGRIWKSLYNTSAGKGTVEKFMQDWNQAKGGRR